MKDIPDHLIFHLKRFDFSLRTLQRSKINDYFAFPHEIDMRPYTIDQLSNPSEEQSADVFELVGVLVHAGTAESGHYYSYIRERPSSKPQESWVEFNDDVVTTWDPSMMESLCFGGTEFRAGSHYGGDGANSMSIDKSYSAYMLFYQRSSSLAREQEALTAAMLTSPVRAEMPAVIADHVHKENTSLVRRHALFDPQHLPFVVKVLRQLNFVKTAGRCSASHQLENTAIQMALSHLDQVASRSKDLTDFRALIKSLLDMGDRCVFCYLAIFDYFDDRPEVFRQLVQRCVDPEVRLVTGSMVISALRSIREAFPRSYGLPAPAGEEEEADVRSEGMEPDVLRVSVRGTTELARTSTILNSAAYLLRILWENFHTLLRSWPEIFGFMLAFVNLGRAELGVFLDMDGLRRLILLLCADSNLSTEMQYTRMLNTIQRRAPSKPPSYENIIGLVSAVLAGMYPLRATTRSTDEMFVDENVSRLSIAVQDPEADLPMSRSEFVLMGRDWVQDYGNIFVDKLVSVNQNWAATDAIIARLMATHPAMEGKVFTTLKANISSNSAANLQGPFLRAAVVFLRTAKSAELAFQLMNHISEQCRNVANSEGRAFFEAQRDIFYGDTALTGRLDVTAILQGLRFLHLWAPGMLGYYDSDVSNDVELFLQDNLFRYGTEPVFDEGEGGVERALAVTTAAKRLGVEGLRYIQLNFIQRNTPISTVVLSSFQRLIADCAPYYANRHEGGEDALSSEFKRLNSSRFPSPAWP